MSQLEERPYLEPMDGVSAQARDPELDRDPQEGPPIRPNSTELFNPRFIDQKNRKFPGRGRIVKIPELRFGNCFSEH